MKIRASFTTCAIFSVIWCLIGVPGIYFFLHGQWSGLLVALCGAIFLFGQLIRYRISWDSEELVYRGLIYTKKIRFDQISKFDIKSSLASDRFAATLGLRIFAEDKNSPVMIINIKPFSREDIIRLLDLLKKTGAK